jgi:hypothetical protein
MLAISTSTVARETTEWKPPSGHASRGDTDASPRMEAMMPAVLSADQTNRFTNASARASLRAQ